MRETEASLAVLGEVQPAVSAAAPIRFSNRRAYAQTFAATAAIRCMGVVSGILAARLLGPAGRGELAVIIFLPLLLVPIGELELPRSVAFEASQPGDFPRKLIATSFWLAVVLGSIQALVLAAVLPLYLPPDKLHLLPASRWFMIYLPAAYVTATLMGCDQGRGRFGRFSFLMALPGALYTLAILAMWGSGRVTPTIFAYGLLAAALLTAAVRVAMDGRANPFGRPDRELARRLLVRGVTFYLPAIAGFVLSRADMFILVRFVPTEAVGLYAVAQAIALGQIGAVLPFVQVGFAAVAREEEREGALAAVAHHFRLAQLAAVGMGLLAAAFTPWAIRTLFGAGFSAAMTPAFLLIGSTALWGMGQVLDQGLRAAGHPRAGIVSNLAGLVVIVALGIPACLRFGINGLAAASLAAQFINLSILAGFCVAELKMTARSLWAFDVSTFKEIAAVAKSSVKRMFANSDGAA
jgi:O-antigen/teichoic acid export membrane protein